MKQLLCYDIDLKETATYIQQIKKQSKEHINNIWNIKNQNYKIENLILLYNNHYKNNNTADYKLKFWWLELYQMIRTSLKKKNYVIAELNSTEKSEIISELKLKIYLKWYVIITQNYWQRLDTHENLSSESKFEDNVYEKQEILALLNDQCTWKSADNINYFDLKDLWNHDFHLKTRHS